MIAYDPNLENLLKIAKRLDDLLDQVVFVGGCAVGLLITDPNAPQIRATQDVDLIVEVTTRKQYYEFSKLLREKGFVEDSEAKILCRWKCDDHIVDVMPIDSQVLGFSNCWYPRALESAQPHQISDGLEIRLIAAPEFIATKIEAFKGRGKNDFLMSADLEDIISVLDGRNEIVEEMKKVPDDLQQYFVLEFKKLLNTPEFLQNLGAYLPGDPASQARLPKLLKTLREIASLNEK